MEAAGKSVLAGLKCPDPGVEGGCPYQKQCYIDPKYTCGGARIIYKLACSLCEASYLGTTGHSAHKRCSEHMEALIHGNDSYAMKSTSYKSTLSETTPPDCSPSQ